MNHLNRLIAASVLVASALTVDGTAALAGPSKVHVAAEARITSDVHDIALTKVSFAIPAPPVIPGIQDAARVSATYEDGARQVPFELKTAKDDIGRTVLVGEFAPPAGQVTVAVRVRYEVDLVEGEAQRQRWGSPQPAELAERTEKLARGADAASVTGDSAAFTARIGTTVLASLPPQMDDYDTVYRICDWMAANCRYVNDGQPQDAASVLARGGTARCEGLANLLAAMVRQRGLRAEVLGMAHATGGKYEDAAFHAVDRVYCAGKGWLPIEPTALVMKRSPNYIGSIGTENLVVQEGLSHFSFADPSDGRRWVTTCKGNFRYQGRRTGPGGVRTDNHHYTWTVLSRS